MSAVSQYGELFGGLQSVEVKGSFPEPLISKPSLCLGVLASLFWLRLLVFPFVFSFALEDGRTFVEVMVFRLARGCVYKYYKNTELFVKL